MSQHTQHTHTHRHTHTHTESLSYTLNTPLPDYWTFLGGFGELSVVIASRGRTSMDPPYVIGLFLVLIVQCEGKPEIGDYIVDCSACNYLALQNVDSYRCSVRCDLESERDFLNNLCKK